MVYPSVVDEHVTFTLVFLDTHSQGSHRRAIGEIQLTIFDGDRWIDILNVQTGASAGRGIENKWAGGGGCKDTADSETNTAVLKRN